MPNNTRYLGLVLFILGSWSAIVVDVFILLDSRFSRNLMAVGGEVAVSLSPGCWLGKCSFCKSCITSHGCEVFRGIVEVLNIWQYLVSGLRISSQATESLVLDDYKSACPRRNKISFLTKPLVWTKGKTFVHTLLPFESGEFWRCPSDDLLHLVLLNLGLFGVQCPVFRFWRGWDKIVKLWKLWQSDK
jgi:hypothetical protein